MRALSIVAEQVHMYSDLGSDAEIAADDNSTDGSAEQSLDTGTDDGEKYIFKDYEEWEIQEIIDNRQQFICCDCGDS